MKNILTAIVALLITAGIYGAKAQPKTFAVTGKVISFEESLGLKGVRVHIKGTTLNTITKPNGLFTIEVPKGNNTLIFELPGYATQEIIITESKAYNIILKQHGNNVRVNAVISCSIVVT